MFIGAHVDLYKHTFILIDADEYAVAYMEKNSHEFPQANAHCVIPKLKKLADEHYEEIQAYFKKYDTNNSGKIAFTAFW